MKSKLTPIEKYKPLWVGGQSIFKYNNKIGYKIRLFCIQELNILRQINPELFNQKDLSELSKMMLELNQEKNNISSIDQNCSLEDYQKFLQDFFKKIDDEDRHGIVTIKTSTKFRLMASFIDVIQSWQDLDEEMKKCKKYCQYKAVDIYKAIKKGEIPKRGGPYEDIDIDKIEDLGPAKEITESIKLIENLNLENNNNIKNENNKNESKLSNNNENIELKIQLNNERDKNKKLEEKIKILENDLNEEKSKNKELNLFAANLKKDLDNEIKKNKEIKQTNKEDKTNKGNELQNSYLETIIEKDKEIKELKLKISRMPFTLEEGEKLMTIIFKSDEENLIYSIICKNTDEFYKIEGQLYNIFPKYSEKENIFFVNGKKINKYKTLEKNDIKNNDVIIFNKKE